MINRYEKRGDNRGTRQEEVEEMDVGVAPSSNAPKGKSGIEKNDFILY